MDEPIDVEYVGPREVWHVVVRGHLVPHLEATPTADDCVYLTLDGRFGLDLTKEDASRVVPFIADCMAVAAGFTGHPDHDQEPQRSHPMPRITAIHFDEPD